MIINSRDQVKPGISIRFEAETAVWDIVANAVPREGELVTLFADPTEYTVSQVLWSFGIKANPDALVILR